jgi:hypothetical protein
MTSIFQRALGADFDRLHPRLRERFGISSENGTACVGTGVMERIWRGSACAVPFLYLGTACHILFPDQGTDVPFTIENYAYRDAYGREAVSFVRTFEIRPHRRRRFDATMVHSPARGGLVDLLGTHHHLAVNLSLRVDARGGLCIRSGDWRCRARRFPAALCASAHVHEWWDDGFHIDVRVANRFLGPIFGYRGRFTARYLDTRAVPVPAALRPLRENAVV